MKRTILILALVGFMTVDFDAVAQDFPELDKSPLDMAYYPPRAAFRAFAKTEEEKKAAEPVMRAIYSRPMKNGRDIFPEVVKYGEIWRLGANESTELYLFQEVTLNGTKLKKGRYTVYAVPGEKEWEIHVSTDNDNWGAYAFKPETSTVAKIKVPAESTESAVEAFGIYFEKKGDDTVHMVIGWDDTMVRVPFKI